LKAWPDAYARADDLRHQHINEAAIPRGSDGPWVGAYLGLTPRRKQSGELLADMRVRLDGIKRAIEALQALP